MKTVNICIMSFLLLLTSGCIKAHVLVRIDKDAAGIISANYTISNEAISRFKRMIELQNQIEDIEKTNKEPSKLNILANALFMPDQNKLRSLFSEYKTVGLLVDHIDVSTHSNNKEVDLKLTFNSLKKLEQVDFFHKYGFNLKRTEYGNYEISRPAMDTQSIANNSNEKTKDNLDAMLAGFLFTLTINTPGNILQTNSHRNTSKAATYSFSFDRNPDVLVEMQKQTIRIIFDGKGLTLPEISL